MVNYVFVSEHEPLYNIVFHWVIEMIRTRYDRTTWMAYDIILKDHDIKFLSDGFQVPEKLLTMIILGSKGY